MRLTAKSEYGLLAMIDLATNGDGQPVSAREIAERQEIPTKFLEQLLVQLRKAGLVSAVRGAHGGFALAAKADSIRVLDVVEALEGPLRSTVCDGDRAEICGRSGACAAAAVWARATDALRAVFESTTVADLTEEQTRIDHDAARVTAQTTEEC